MHPTLALSQGPDPLDEAIDTAFERLWKGQKESTLLEDLPKDGKPVCDADSCAGETSVKSGPLPKAKKRKKSRAG